MIVYFTKIYDEPNYQQDTVGLPHLPAKKLLTRVEANERA